MNRQNCHSCKCATVHGIGQEPSYVKIEIATLPGNEGIVTRYYCNVFTECVDQCMYDLEHGFKIVHVHLNEEENQ